MKILFLSLFSALFNLVLCRNQYIVYSAGIPNITVITTKDESIRLHYYGSAFAANNQMIPVMKTDIIGTALEVSVERRSNINQSVRRNELKLDIYLPENYKDSLSLVTSSGNISIGNLNLKGLEISTSSGDIRAEKLIAGEISIKTSSGRAYIDLIEANNLRQQSSSGNVNIGKIESDTTYLQTSSGRINIDKIITESLQHRASSGNITIQSIEVEHGSFTSSSGKINLLDYIGDLTVTSSSGDIVVEYLEFDNDIAIAASSGKVDLKLPKTSEFYAKLTTNSGGINLDFPIEVKESSRREIRGVVGSDRNSVNIATSSGRISVTN